VEGPHDGFVLPQRGVPEQVQVMGMEGMMGSEEVEEERAAR
jgi:hypothetical protein